MDDQEGNAEPEETTAGRIVAAGGAAPWSSISSNRNSAVGAFPMATMAPFRCGRQNSSAAADRVFSISAASCATPGSSSVQTTLLFSGSLLRVIP